MPNVVIYVVTPWYNLPNKTSPVDASALNHIETGIKNVTDFVNTLNVENGKVMGSAAFTTALLNKLNGIEEQANKYILPVATNTILGGVKVDGNTIVIEDGVIRSTTSGITELEGLSDVNLTDLADGQILKYDDTSGKWVNTSEAEVRTQLSLLEDVDIDDTSLEDGQVLKYNGTSEKWENGEGGDVLGYNETIDILGLPPNPVYRLRIATPVMTSNTTPKGKCACSSYYDNNENYNAFRAFDGVVGESEDCWISLRNSVANQWISYEFDMSTCITKFVIRNRRANVVAAPRSFKIQGSNDGITFTDIQSYENLNNIGNVENEFEIENPSFYKIYRIYILTGHSNEFVSISNLDLYEKYLA